MIRTAITVTVAAALVSLVAACQPDDLSCWLPEGCPIEDIIVHDPDSSTNSSWGNGGSTDPSPPTTEPAVCTVVALIPEQGWDDYDRFCGSTVQP